MACVRTEPPRTHKQLRAILRAVDTINPVVALMLEFSALTGLRYSDVSRLRFSDVYINGVIRDSIVVIQTKPFNKRITAGVRPSAAKEASRVNIHIGAQCKELVEDIRHINHGKALMFESAKKKGKPYTAQWCNQILKVVAKDMKLNFPLATHSFRKSFAQSFINKNAKVHQVRDALGQSSLASTDRYLQSFSSDTAKIADLIKF